MRNGLSQSTYDQIITYFLGQSSVYIDSMNLSEWHIYGSSRLGIYQTSINMAYRNIRIVNSVTTQETTTTVAWPSYTLFDIQRGAKRYELTNHLGNVLAVVSDKKIQVCTSTTISYYTADLVSATDYSPFGAPLAGRSYTAPNISYRFAFNGKEKDDEVNGEGNAYDFGDRIQDPRLGRWLSIDPEFKKYPYSSPYTYAGNSPTFIIDLEGRENIIYIVLLNDGKTKLSIEDAKAIQALTQVRLDKLGVNVSIRIVNPKDFKTENLDKSDAVVVFGKRSAVNRFIKGNAIDPKTIKERNMWDKGNWSLPGNWEKSSNTGNVVGISTYDDYSVKDPYNGSSTYEDERDDLKEQAKNLKTTKIDIASLTILHGLGHNVGKGHFGDGTTKSQIMYEGNALVGQNRPISSMVLPGVNKDYVLSLKLKFKDEATPGVKLTPQAKMKTL